MPSSTPAPTSMPAAQPQPLPVVLLGDVGLLQPARLIPDVTAPEVQQLVDDLVSSCVASGGVGIAAPQLGVALRAFLVASRPSPRYPDAPQMAPLPMLNPVVTPIESEGRVGGWEGCLSIPGLRGWVERWRVVDVRWQNLEGAHQYERFTGFVARIVQHEADHLDGVLFLHRVAGPQDLAHESAWSTHPRYLVAPGAAASTPPSTGAPAE